MKDKRKKITLALFLFALTGALHAAPLYTITVRGLNKQFPLIAWQMTYRITADTQKEAELQAMANARRDGCEETSAYIVETTITLTPDDKRPAAPVIIVATPQNPPQESKPVVEVIEYDEAYRAGYDHGITGFLTNRGNFILNTEIPEKYRESEQGQAYKNGYARGYADEELKAERAKRKLPKQPTRAENEARRTNHNSR